MTLTSNQKEGLVLLDKPVSKSSFYLVSVLRRLTNIRKIGHAGTLDPFATGLMILLVGKNYTKKADTFLKLNKEYIANVKLGQNTDTYDTEGKTTFESSIEPTTLQIEEAIERFQGGYSQIPPMFSAKKVKGKKLYELARAGVEIPREPKDVQVDIELISYSYPDLKIHVKCSSGTYIRSLAYDIGQTLGCGAHLSELVRTKIGSYELKDAQTLDELDKGAPLNFGTV